MEEERLREKHRLKEEAKEMDNNTVDHDAVLKALSRALEATEEAYLDMTYRYTSCTRFGVSLSFRFIQSVVEKPILYMCPSFIFLDLC